MITWLALGLVVVVAVGAVVMDRRHKDQTEKRIKSLGVRIDRSVREPVELTEEQRRDLNVTWGILACSSCGNVHPGLCPRVREVRYSPNGNYERVIFWNDDRWELPEGTITPWDMWGTVAPPPKDDEVQK